MQLTAIRRFRDGEMNALLDMRRAMTLELDAQDLDAEIPAWRARFKAFLDELIARDAAMFFVAELGEKLIGIGGVYKLRNHRSEIYGKPSAYITSIYVAPEHRRQGIATRIMLHQLRVASAGHCARDRGSAGD